MALTATVLGASGFSGGELLRLLVGHPEIDVVAAGAHSAEGRSLREVQPHLDGDAPLGSLGEVAGVSADVCFSCLPGGVLPDLIAETQPDAKVVIDLADDHRSSDGWAYGLTEFGRAEVAGAERVANPGCYPTATLLALVPFARAGAIDGPVIVDALSGTSGAGRSVPDHLGFAQMFGDAGAYGSTEHRHVPEMERYLKRFGDIGAVVSFTPHLIPVARGLVVTARGRLTGSLTDRAAIELLRDAYDEEPFVTVGEEWPSVKPVAGSNRAAVSARIDRRGGWLIAAAAIDNLGKGAAGQAVQNANVALGLEETLGLSATGVWP